MYVWRFSWAAFLIIIGFILTRMSIKNYTSQTMFANIIEAILDIFLSGSSAIWGVVIGLISILAGFKLLIFGW